MKKSFENQLRYWLKKEGYLLRKSRIKNINLDNLGGYMIVDGYSNFVVAGSKFELNLEDVLRFLQIK